MTEVTICGHDMLGIPGETSTKSSVEFWCGNLLGFLAGSWKVEEAERLREIVHGILQQREQNSSAGAVNIPMTVCAFLIGSLFWVVCGFQGAHMLFLPQTVAFTFWKAIELDRQFLWCKAGKGVAKDAGAHCRKYRIFPGRRLAHWWVKEADSSACDSGMPMTRFHMYSLIQARTEFSSLAIALMSNETTPPKYEVLTALRYNYLCPSMIARDEWAFEDDRALLKTIWTSGARSAHELAWEVLVPGRSEGKVSGSKYSCSS